MDAVIGVGVAVLVIVVAASCHDRSPAYARLLPDVAASGPRIQNACMLAAERCTQCHPIDRVLTTNRFDRSHWEVIVDRMRLKPSSGITLEESAVILDCLANREPVAR